TSITPNLPEASAKLRSAVTAAARGLVDREPLVELVALSAVAREHLLVIGPPGTAKSVAVRRIAQATGGRYGTSISSKTFETMLKKLPFPRNPLALSSNRYFSLSLEPLPQSLLRY
ncbi:MAG TPA: hypothetical protein VNO32_44240, partial [Candidatus Acidoferrum sp.]|nr:hypothetical protein [Candidatus Acidoferrum sp.]